MEAVGAMKRPYLALLGILALICASCATAHSGKRIRQYNVSEIVKGTTTRADIERTFGKPMTVSLNSEGKPLYYYSYTEVESVAFSNKMRLQTLAIMFDQNDVVETYVFNDAPFSSGLGRD